MKRITAKDLKNARDSFALSDALLDAVQETLLYYDNMMGDKFRAPNLGNATIGFLVDEIAQLKAEIKPRETYEKLLKGILNQHRENGETNWRGEQAQGKFKFVVKRIPDQDKLKAHVTAAGLEWDEFCKESSYWEFRTTELDEEVNQNKPKAE